MRPPRALLPPLTLVLALSWAPLTAHAGRPIPAHVQVLVVGGSPGGIAAAVAASRAGMTTLLVEPQEEIGGEINLGWVNVLNLNLGTPGQYPARGNFVQMYRAVGQAFAIGEAQKV